MQFWSELNGMKNAQAYFLNPHANHRFYFLWFFKKKNAFESFYITELTTFRYNIR